MAPELQAVAARQCGLFSRRQALEAGYSPGEIRQLLKRDWIRLRAGYYVSAGHWATLTPTERHRTMLLARLVDKPAAVVSHASAAVVHRLPLLGSAVPPRLTMTRSSGADVNRADLHIAVAPLADDDIVVIDGLCTTSAARTVLDCARTMPFVDAVVLADAALQRGSTSPDVLHRAAERQSGWPGAPAARRVVAFADGRAETPGESVSRVVFVELGLPKPELQVTIQGADGSSYRTDFYWEAYRTVGEFDGAVKYRGDKGADVVFAEKIREDGLRDAGNDVFRWVWRDLYQGRDELARRANRSLIRGRRLIARRVDPSC